MEDAGNLSIIIKYQLQILPVLEPLEKEFVQRNTVIIPISAAKQ